VLREAGIAKGDRVVVVIPKIPEWLFCMTALLRIGAVAVPSAEQLRAKDLLFRANHGGATAVIAPAANAAQIFLAGAREINRSVVGLEKGRASGDPARWAGDDPH